MNSLSVNIQVAFRAKNITFPFRILTHRGSKSRYRTKKSSSSFHWFRDRSRAVTQVHLIFTRFIVTLSVVHVRFRMCSRIRVLRRFVARPFVFVGRGSRFISGVIVKVVEEIR